jgi:BirA family biotin operon repressor/biotin-[acetyl-CoA-carboxylase] ligase
LDFPAGVIRRRRSRYNVHMSDLLDADRIAAQCSAVANGLFIEVVAETASTNADLRQRIDQLRSPVLRVAEQQTAGRGRAGRAWYAVRGDSLCFSLAWPFSRGLMQLAGLPLAVGVALADTLRALGYPVTLKWPNDLLLDAAKLGGVLVETGTARTERSEGVWAVIGVGLNVHPNSARDTGVPHDVAALGENIDRNALLATITDTLVDALRSFDQQGLAPFITGGYLGAAPAAPRLGIECGGCVNQITAGSIIAHKWHANRVGALVSLEGAVRRCDQWLPRPEPAGL